MGLKTKILLSLLRHKLVNYRFGGDVQAIQAYRWKKFQKVLLKSPFYKNLAESKAPLSEYPIIDKAVFMSNFDTINTATILLNEAMEVAIKAETTRDFNPTIKDITVGLSTGTSGNRGIFLANESDRANWVAQVLTRVIGLSLKKRKVAFFLRSNSTLYQSVASRMLEFRYFDTHIPISEHVDQLISYQPDIIVGQPSLLVKLAALQQDGTLNLRPSKIISVAEVLTPEDKNLLSAAFHQIIHQVYQCTEGFLAVTCEHGTLHFNEDYLIIEKKYLDETKTRYTPIISDLLRTAQPVVRYELNDIIIGKSKCPCGSPYEAIEAIEGRCDDILVFTTANGQQVDLYPDFLRRAIVLADEEIIDYSVIKSAPNTLKLYIKSNNKDSYINAKIALTQLLQTYDIQLYSIIMLNSDPTQLGNKKRRIRNES